jgi:hypothetical protein
VGFVIGVIVASGLAHYVFIEWICALAPRLRPHRTKLRAVAVALVVLPLLARWLARASGSDLVVSLQAVFAGEQMIVVLGALPMLLLLGAIAVVRLVARRVRKDPPAVTREEALSRRQALVRVAGGVAWGTTGALLGWGLVRGRHAFQLEEVVVKIPRLPRSLDGYVIAQVSDIHVGPFVRERELGEAFDLLRGLRPDLLLATGDIVDFDARYAPLFARLFADLPARDGHLAILGNHDHYAGATAVREHLERAGIEVLHNRALRVRPKDGAGIVVAGVDDMWARPDLDRALAGIADDAARILLAHQPRYFDVAAGRVDLQLSGHTHGGQVNPGFRPADLLMKYVSGRYEKSGSVLWVNRGVGVAAVPSRVAAPPEVTKIVLVAG